MKTALLHYRPDLNETDLVRSTYGRSSHVARSPREVFKGHKGGKKAFKKEYRILRHLQGKGRKVPEISFELREGLFFGTKIIPGFHLLCRHQKVPLALHDFNKAAQACAEEICSIASCFTAAQAQRLVGKDQTPYAAIAMATQRLQSNAALRAAFANDKDILEGLEKYLSRFTRAKPEVIHGDMMNPGNFLFDPSTRALTGILDFGMVHYALPETILPLPYDPMSTMMMAAIMRNFGRDPLDTVFYSIAAPLASKSVGGDVAKCCIAHARVVLQLLEQHAGCHLPPPRSQKVFVPRPRN